MSLASLPKRVIITEVGPRDGLQNEVKILSLDQKEEFVRRLADARCERIEVGSFVRKEWVPQMADTQALIERIADLEDVLTIALVPNQKGLELALESSVKGVAVFTAVSETFTKKNTNMTKSQSLEASSEVARRALAKGRRVRAYISTCFACPYEGEIKTEQVLPLVQHFLDLGVDEISFGDTIGRAHPKTVIDLGTEILKLAPEEKFAFHFHDTQGMALVNCFTALQLGFARFDSSSGGLGGCPYALGASGNLATEDLLYLLDTLAIKSGVSLDKIVSASRYVAQILQKSLPSRVLSAYGATCL